MIPRISWFSSIDYQIWALFRDHDLIMSRKVLAANLDYDADYTGKRLRKLRDAGFLEQREDSLYQLSDLGRELLADNLSKEEIEALNPDSDDTDD